MPDSPGRRAAWRTHAAGDNISQYQTSSYAVKCKHLQFIKSVCSGVLLGIQPFSPGSSVNQPTSACNTWAGWAFPTKTAGGCKFCLAKQSQSPENKQSYRWRGKRQSVKALGSGRHCFPAALGIGNTEVLWMSPPTARRNCQWEISLGYSEYL